MNNIYHNLVLILQECDPDKRLNKLESFVLDIDGMAFTQGYQLGYQEAMAIYTAKKTNSQIQYLN